LPWQPLSHQLFSALQIFKVIVPSIVQPDGDLLAKMNTEGDLKH